MSERQIYDRVRESYFRIWMISPNDLRIEPIQKVDSTTFSRLCTDSNEETTSRCSDEREKRKAAASLPGLREHATESNGKAQNGGEKAWVYATKWLFSTVRSSRTRARGHPSRVHTTSHRFSVQRRAHRRHKPPRAAIVISCSITAIEHHPIYGWSVENVHRQIIYYAPQTMCLGGIQWGCHAIRTSSWKRITARANSNLQISRAQSVM